MLTYSLRAPTTAGSQWQALRQNVKITISLASIHHSHALRVIEDCSEERPVVQSSLRNLAAHTRSCRLPPPPPLPPRRRRCRLHRPHLRRHHRGRRILMNECTS